MADNPNAIAVFVTAAAYLIGLLVGSWVTFSPAYDAGFKAANAGGGAVSDSGRHIGECTHGRERVRCHECNPVYRVKPLVWRDCQAFHVARTVFGNIYVSADLVDLVGRNMPCESIAHGKQLAEAWYREMLISEALEVVTE